MYEEVVADPGARRGDVVDLVAQARASRDREALVVALRASAWVERTLLRAPAAKELLDEAVRLARSGPVHRLPEVLTTRAVVNQELGRAAAARRDLDAAGALASAGHALGPELALQQAVLRQNSGDGAGAEALYAALLADPSAPALLRAKAANNLALVEAQTGRAGAALQHLDEAAALAVAGGSTTLVAVVAQSRGWVLLHAGRLPDSMAQLDTAAALWRAAGLPPGEPYVEQADALADLRLVEEALGLARAAAASFREHGALLLAVEAQHRVARLALRAGRPDDALREAEALEALLDGQDRPAWRARAGAVLAEARLATGRCTAEELDRARRSARTLDRLGQVGEAVDAYLVAGRCALAQDRQVPAQALLRRAEELSRGGTVLLRLKGRLAAALAAGGDVARVTQLARAGMRDLAEHRDALGSVELRALASGHGAELGVLALRTLRSAAGGAAPVRLLDWMERTRAAALTAPPAEQRTLVPRPADPEQEELLARLRLLHRRVDDDPSAAPALRQEVQEVEERLRRGAWSRSAERARRHQRPVPVAELRRLLDGTPLVELAAVDDRLLAVVLEARRSRVVELGPLEPVRRERDALLFTLRGLSTPRPPAVTAALRRSAEGGLARLRAALLDPLRVRPDAPLVVVPSAALHGVPWSALHDGPVAAAPSATLWARTRAGAPRAGGVLLAAGPDLQGAVPEVRALAALHPGAEVLEPPRSTAAAVTASLARADLAHLACHGVLRADNPLFSALLLSDGPLTVHELALRRAAPRRVVLAACDSAADTTYAGGEMLGFVGALVERGTAGLVASGVPVPDVGSVPLMRALHEGLARGATMSVALHGARAAVDLDDPVNLVSWAAYTAFGAA
ncbi:CHAT domain-containing protein [Vallicoccus soli]|uniref:CHAT domain-containing protein n=1 Tax=Vallicoccus soli TaxID=2339232 RepID=A0A3A3Z5J4_9ACTN|nr:CHAT domain-containing protein [Vallicoccus soli]